MEHCDIEEHAVLFALMAKEIISSFGDEGTEIVRECVRTYGSERGMRMQERCIRHNDPLSPLNYQAYNERSSKSGQMNSVFYQKSPEFIIHVEKCAWVDAWKKHGLLEYGKYYCLDIDRSLTRGFSKGEYEVEICGHLSWGCRYCDMHWGFEMTEEKEEYIRKKKTQLASEGAILSYDYHTGHLFSSFCTSIKKMKGDEGLGKIKKAAEEFALIFSEEKVRAFREAYPMSEEAEAVLK